MISTKQKLLVDSQKIKRKESNHTTTKKKKSSNHEGRQQEKKGIKELKSRK